MIWNVIKRFFGGRNDAAFERNERESARYNVTMFARYQGTGTFIERRGNIGIGGFCFEGENGRALQLIQGLLRQP